MIGDFIFDLLTKIKNDQGRKLQRILSMFGRKNVIKRSIRVAASAETITDLTISSEPSKVIKSGSLDPGISDHKLVYSAINLQKPVKKPRIKMVKNYKNMNIEELKKKPYDIPWWVTNIFDDVS